KHALTDIDGNPREAEPGEAPLEISADCKAFMKINDVCSAEIEEHCSSDFYGGDIMIRSAGASPSGPSRRRSELAARRRCRSRRPRRRGGRRGEGRLEGEAEGGQAAGDEGHQEGGQGPEAPPPPQEERPVRWRAARPPRARAGSSGLLYFPLSPHRTSTLHRAGSIPIKNYLLYVVFPRYAVPRALVPGASAQQISHSRCLYGAMASASAIEGALRIGDLTVGSRCGLTHKKSERTLSLLWSTIGPT
ncbi:unnamed protein product, partial [Prorocentrum cordatum]